MNFLSPQLLWGLFAVALPVIIHLLNRRRFRTVRWAATSFLLKAARESRGRKRLKHILILTARALAVAALIFAVSRPLVGGLLGWGGGSVETIVLLLDRSASMELRPDDGRPSQREAVLTRLAGAIQEMGSPRVILIDSATRQPQEIASPEVLPEISDTQATDTQTDIPGLLLSAIDYLQETQLGHAEIWLASDLQAGDWKRSDGRWQAVRTGLKSLPEETRLRVLSLDRGEAQNLSLTLISARRIDDELFLDLEISQAQDLGPRDLPVTYSLEGSRTAERATLEGQFYRFQKRLALPAMDPEGFGWVALPTDLNPRDNVVYFTYGKAPERRTVIVTSNPAADSIRDLQRAAAPPGLTGTSAEVISPARTSGIDFPSTSLLIWQAPLPQERNALLLRQFIEGGGIVLFFPPEQKAETSFLGVSWGPSEDAPQDQFFINGSWRRDDGPWRDGANGQALPVRDLRAVRRTAILGEASALADWDDQTPLMARTLFGAGRAVFIGTRAEETWSNLEFTALHLVAVQRLLDAGQDRLTAGSRALAGEEAAKTRNDEVRRRLDDYEDLQPALAPFRGGVYQLGERLLAVNRNPAEDQLELLDEESLDELLEGTRFTLFEEQDQSEDLVQEIWRLFLAAMLIFLLIEAFLCLQKKPTVTP